MSIASARALLIVRELLNQPGGVYYASDLDPVLQAVQDAIAVLNPDEGSDSVADGSLGVDLTLAPYNADKTGTDDVSPVLQDALDDGLRTIFFPAGTYKFLTKMLLPNGTVLFGENSQTTFIDAEDTRWLELTTNSDPSFDLTYSRCRVADFTIKMTAGGILSQGYENKLENLYFSGGAAGSWCIELHLPRYCTVRNVTGGYGGGTQALAANGLRIYITDAAGERDKDYGYSLLDQVSFLGTGANWTGFSLDSVSTHATLGVIRHVTSRGLKAEQASVLSGTKGLYLRRIQRNQFDAVEMVNLTTGMDIGSTTGTLGATSTKRNEFQSLRFSGCTNNYVDSTSGGLAGSVGKNTYYNSPLMAGAGSLSDLQLGGTIFFEQPGTQAHKIAERISANAHWILSSINQVSSVYDSADDNLVPLQALAVDFMSNANVTQIYRPTGYASGQERRIVIGNGRAFTITNGGGSIAVGPNHRVEIADPFYMSLWTVATPAGLGSGHAGMLINGGDLAAIGSPTRGYWAGPGNYQFMDDADQAQFSAGTRVFVPQWYPVQPRPGFGWAEGGRSATSYTLDRSWFGKLSFMTNATSCTFTINAGLIRTEEYAGSGNHQPSMEFKLRLNGAGNVVITPGTNVTLYKDGVTATSATVTIASGTTATLIYVRNSDGTVAVVVFNN